MKSDHTFIVRAQLISAGLLAVTALLVWLQGSNTELFLAINHQAHRLPDALWSNLTFSADTLFAMTLLLAAASFRPQLLGQGLLLLLLGTLITQGGKALFDAARPAATLALDSFYIIGPKLRHHSFPSGHSFTVFATVALIATQMPARWLLPLLLLASSAAASRIAVGAHWPLDVLTGSALGILTATTVSCWKPLPAWLEHPAGLLFSAVLLTVAALWLPFFNSHYPHTAPLACTTSLLALFLAVKRFWWPLAKQTRNLTRPAGR